MIIAVLSSTVATTQTTLLPAARIAFSMARERVFPRIVATIQGKVQRPAIGTLLVSFVCIFKIVLVSSVTSVSHVFSNLISNIGVLIAFYYGVTGVTCAWAYRQVAFQQTWSFFSGVPAPLLGGAALLFVGGEVISSVG